MPNFEDDSLEAMNKLNDNLSEVKDMIERMTEMAKGGCLAKESHQKQSNCYDDEMLASIYSKEYEMNYKCYYYVQKNQCMRRDYMVVIEKNGGYNLIGNNGLLLFLSKVYAGGFECRKDIIYNPKKYKDYIMDKIHENWRTLIEVRFGFGTGIVISQNDVAKIFNTTMHEVREIEERSVYRIKKTSIRRARHDRQGQIIREKEDKLLSLGDEKYDIVQIEPISCELVDFMEKHKICNLKELDNHDCLLNKYGLKEEADRFYDFIN